MRSNDSESSTEAICGQPAFQEVSIQQLNKNDSIAFLVGQVEKVHWSMSVEVDSSAQRLIFEIAARVAAASKYRSLANRYQVLQPNSKLNQENNELVLEIDSNRYRLKMAAVKLPDLERSAKMNLLDDEFEVQPLLDISSLPATLSWKYAISREKS